MQMPKRFTDTDIWEKEWYMSLNPKLKCLVSYVRDKCDIAGIWKPNFMLASYVIGEKVTEEELLLIDEGRQFEKLDSYKIICVDFVKFQYGSELNPSSPIHRKVIDILEKNAVDFNIKEGTSRVTKPTYEMVFNKMKESIDEGNAKIQASKFINYYESNGWKVGKNAMKSWEAAVRSWLSRANIVNTSSIKERLKQIGNKKISEL